MFKGNNKFNWRKPLNCALRIGVQGTMGPGAFADPQEWQKTVQMNLCGVFFTLRAFYPLLLKPKQKN